MKCPGQDTQYWLPGAIFEAKCPQCGHTVEFFKDDTSRKCNHCGHRFVNPKMDFGCAAYCQYAEQCLGTLPPELLAQKEDLLKDRVAIEMKRYFKSDFKRIGHASRVARYAERIGKLEGGNLAVILSAAYLHDIGMSEAEKKYGDKAAQHHEAEGPAIAGEILNKLGASQEIVKEVCDIIGHHHRPADGDSLNFKVVYDADLLENMDEKRKQNPLDHEKLAADIEAVFLTDSGRDVAAEVLLG
jgi:HD superfamily phosphohydrolase YqeK